VPRALLLLPTTTYKASDFLAAAEKLRLSIVVASEEASALEGLNPEGLLTLDFQDPEACAQKAAAFAKGLPIDVVVGVDEQTAVVGAAISEALGLPHNPIAAVQAAADKAMMRELLAKAGVPAPRARLFQLAEGPGAAMPFVRFPCVVKPTFLAASRGVIRANDGAELAVAWARVSKLLSEPELTSRGAGAARQILVEDFVAGAEVAVEGILKDGRLTVLAIFDKPDPLDGPFFEETIYVTPSRMPSGAQDRLAAATRDAAVAMGLRDGPVHAELRWNERGPWVIEIAARSIGGLCSRTLRFGIRMSLEELLLRHALGQDVNGTPVSDMAAGVMMIPIPRGGVFQGVDGLEEAKAVGDIEDAVITAHPTQRIVPLPEGGRYLGFLFSRAETAERAEAALREAHAKLSFRIS
jgi:formate-dependent phosphoribosylglycinamide formyltransferase (GAR transformylase)